MSEPYWRRSAPRVAALLAVAGTAAITGCSSGGANGAAGSPSATSSSGMTAAPVAQGSIGYTANQLRGALLSKVNGVGPAVPAESGAYGQLQAVRTSKQSMHGVMVKPAECAQTTVSGFDTSAFGSSPASVETFRVGRDGVSEIMVAASSAAAAKALDSMLPAGCMRYTATTGGKTYAYAVREAPVPGLAEQARMLNVKAPGYASVDDWSVIYRGKGYVGAVSIIGPDASGQGVLILAKQAYSLASASLH